MAIVYLGLGSNLGDKELNLKQATNNINRQIGKVIALSAYYYSAPLGFKSKNNFVNSVIKIETNLQAMEILRQTQQIEKQMGRTTKSHNKEYTDRIIDIDILLYDDNIMQNSELEIPHPQLHLREFVLFPLKEISPELIHPTLNRTIESLAKDIDYLE